jgi:hypothetical protein
MGKADLDWPPARKDVRSSDFASGNVSPRSLQREEELLPVVSDLPL